MIPFAKILTTLAMAAAVGVSLLPSLPSVDGARILAVFAFPGKSHNFMLQTLTTALVERGHELVVISNFPLSSKMVNYTDVVIEPIYDFWSDVKEVTKVQSLFDLADMSFDTLLKMMHTIGYSTTAYALHHPNVKNFIRTNNEHFDLILAEQFYQEAFLMFAHKYNAPIVTIGTFGFAQYMSPLMGVLSPWAQISHEFKLFDTQMGFGQRLENVAIALWEYVQRDFYYLAEQERMAVEAFAEYVPGPLPSLRQLERNISVMLLNSHVSLTQVRPTVAGIIQVGGLHIKSPKALPTAIKKFIDNARHGAIYFSLGTNLRSADMPPETLRIFLKVFGELKQRVIWKWEDTGIADLPDNVMVHKWLPQSDILAHPHVQAFITHGGLMSTQEGVHRAVPMIGIPIYCDQHINMANAEKNGYAIRLHFNNITEDSLRWALSEIYNNPSYTINVRRLSKLFRDRLSRPLEEALFWIDYVIRYRGAPHLRSSALDMSWSSYMLLDIVAFIALIVITIVVSGYGLLRFLMRRRASRVAYKKFN